MIMRIEDAFTRDKARKVLPLPSGRQHVTKTNTGRMGKELEPSQRKRRGGLALNRGNPCDFSRFTAYPDGEWNKN